MQSRERVIEVIEHRRPDRVPVYAWVKANMTDQISKRFGSVEAFEDHYEFDFAHLFGGPPRYAKGSLDTFKAENRMPTPAELLDIPMIDPDDKTSYEDIINGIRHHKEQRARFVYVQTPGIFEANNGPFGIENHLMYLALYEDELHRVYQRQAEWNRKFAMNCLDLGVDMIHVSDDWGSQTSLLFSPETWHRLIRPYHKVTCDAVKQRGAYLSLHCDGNFRAVLDDVIDLGYNVVHPFQESAGMDLTEFRDNFRDRLSLMGGLCIQTTLGFGKRDFLEKEIRRVLGMFRDGGLLYCTSHFVQEHCTIEELVFAYDLIHESVTCQK
jgi:uroporphyrinogen decarboxylase